MLQDFYEFLQWRKLIDNLSPYELSDEMNFISFVSKKNLLNDLCRKK